MKIYEFVTWGIIAGAFCGILAGTMLTIKDDVHAIRVILEKQK
jgi:hypothetical protein